MCRALKAARLGKVFSRRTASFKNEDIIVQTLLYQRSKKVAFFPLPVKRCLEGEQEAAATTQQSSVVVASSRHV